MRGTPHLVEAVGADVGIIPAYAGNTCLSMMELNAGRDHPRVCGEHRRWVSATSSMPGSSPRMRGTHSKPKETEHEPGIIPAYAGNTPPSNSGPSRNRDHPRVCGEHLSFVFCRRGVEGSSPRMRGTL